jgi:hypothetical protein
MGDLLLACSSVPAGLSPVRSSCQRDIRKVGSSQTSCAYWSRPRILDVPSTAAPHWGGDFESSAHQQSRSYRPQPGIVGRLARSRVTAAGLFGAAQHGGVPAWRLARILTKGPRSVARAARGRATYSPTASGHTRGVVTKE